MTEIQLTLASGPQRLCGFFFLLKDRYRNSLCKSVCISLPDTGKSSDHGILLCRIGHCQILPFSDKTFWNVTPYSVLASYLFLIIETVSSSMASVTLWQTMSRCRQEDISVHISKIFTCRWRFLTESFEDVFKWHSPAHAVKVKSKNFLKFRYALVSVDK